MLSAAERSITSTSSMVNMGVLPVAKPRRCCAQASV